jgi:hypothetical protein
VARRLLLNETRQFAGGIHLDKQLSEFGPDRGPGRTPPLLVGTAAAIPAGMKYGALVGAGSGCLWGIFWYPFVLFFTIPVYALAGVLIGALTGVLVGTVSAAARSVKAGWFAGGGAGLAVGLALLAGACLAPARPPPFAPGQPINPAADADEERILEQNYLLWMAEWDQGERGAFILFVALPATLCAQASAWGAARRLRSRSCGSSDDFQNRAAPWNERERPR